MWSGVWQWLARVLWPFLRESVFPLVWAWIKSNSDVILSWLFERIRGIFERDTEATLQYAQEQEDLAKKRAGEAPSDEIAEAWKEAAEFWRKQYESVQERYERNCTELQNLMSKARADLHDVVDSANPEVTFSSDKLHLRLGGHDHMLEPPSQ